MSLKASINPYLIFNGQCEEAMQFYAHCFQGEITMMNPYKNIDQKDLPPLSPQDENKIVHAHLNTFAGEIMACDTLDQDAVQQGSHVQLSINLNDVEKGKIIFDKLSQGGKIVQPYAKQFWGDVFGSLVDIFSTQWLVNATIEK